MSLLGVSSGGGALGSLAMIQLSVDGLLDDHAVALTEVEPWLARSISFCRRYYTVWY